MDTDAINHNGISHLCIEGWNERGVPFIGGMQALPNCTSLAMRITSIISGILLTLSGCNLVLPEVANQPVIRNPFPQLSHIAVAPFFNHSDESTVDGRQFAMAYYAELQKTPGFKVVPLGVVEEAMIDHRIDLNGPGEARRLAQLLGVDAVVVGAVTDFSPYYPPRCGLRVEWYSANPGFHEIPVGYGLPWNTPAEEFIPDSLIYESQLAHARSQMSSLSPNCDDKPQTLPTPPQPFSTEANPNPDLDTENNIPSPTDSSTNDSTSPLKTTSMIGPSLAIGQPSACLPDHACSQPGIQSISQPACIPYHGPVMSHTQIYLGNEPHVTQALKNYVYFHDDARFGGWEAYLQRSDDFIRFCSNLHISEMLSARGGSRKTRVVLRWPDSR